MATPLGRVPDPPDPATLRQLNEEGQIGRLNIWAEQVVTYLRELESRVTRLEAGDTGPDLR